MPPKSKPKGGSAKKAGIPTPRTIPELELVLRAFLGGNPGEVHPDQIDQHIRNATLTLQAFVDLPQSVPALFSRLAMTDQPQDTRQLACVLLCKKIMKFWPGLQKTKMLNPSRSDAESCREIILTILHSANASPSVLHSLSYLTFLIARSDLNKNRWPAIIDWLSGALQSSIAHVDCSLRVLSNLLPSGNAGLKFVPHIDTYFPVFLHWITNAPTNQIRNRAVMALRPLIDLVTDDEKQENMISTSILEMLAPLAKCAETHDYESIKSIINMFRAGVGSIAWETHNIAIFQALCPILLNTSIDILIRHSVADFFIDVIADEPITFTTPQTLPDGTTIFLIDILFQLIFGLLFEEDDNPFETPDINPQKIAIQLIEPLYAYIPTHRVFPIIIDHYTKFIHSPNPLERKAAHVLAIISSTSAPNPTHLGDTLTINGKTATFLVTAIDQCCAAMVTETHPVCRLALCYSLVYFGESLEGVISQYGLWEQPLKTALQVIPTISLEHDPNYRRCLLTVLDIMATAGGKQITPYLPDLVGLLLTQLQLPSIKHQETTMRSLQYVVESVEDNIQPYVAQLFPIFWQVLSTPSTPDILGFQQKTLITLGSTLRFLPLEQWGPEITQRTQSYIAIATEALFQEELDDYSQLQSYIAFLSSLIPPFSRAPHTPELVKFFTDTYNGFIRVIKSLDGVTTSNENQDEPTLSGWDDDEDDILLDMPEDPDELDDDDYIDGDTAHYFDTASIDVKTSTLTALSILFDELGSDIFKITPEKIVDHAAITNHIIELSTTALENKVPYVQPDMAELEKKFLVSTDPLLRVIHALLESIEMIGDAYLGQALISIAQCAIDAFRGMNVLEVHKGVRHHPLSEYLGNVFDPLIFRLIEAVQEEQSPDVVANALESIGSLLQHFGASVISEPLIKPFYKCLKRVITEEASCFVDKNSREELSDQGQSALSAAFVLFDPLARIFGSLFKQEFLEVKNGAQLKVVTDLCFATNRPLSFRAPAIGALADIIRYLPPEEIAPLAANSLVSALPLLSTTQEMDDLNNFAFLIRVSAAAIFSNPLAQQLDATTIQNTFQVLNSKILPPEQYKVSSHVDQSLVDNFVSAIFNLIRTFPQHLPYNLLHQVCASLPLLGDMTERVTIAENLPYFYTHCTDIMRPLTGHVVAHIACLLENPPVPFPEEPQVIAFAKQLVTQFPQEAATAAQFLSPAYSNAMTTFQTKLHGDSATPLSL